MGAFHSAQCGRQLSTGTHAGSGHGFDLRKRLPRPLGPPAALFRARDGQGAADGILGSFERVSREEVRVVLPQTLPLCTFCMHFSMKQ